MAHILIVDDSPTDAQAVKSALEAEGYQVSVAAEAAAGLEMAEQMQPDLIFMDVVFQGMSGFQGTRKLARNPKTAAIPVVIISGKDQESDRVWGLRQGATEYLVKPVTPPVILDTVKRLLTNKPGTPA